MSPIAGVLVAALGLGAVDDHPLAIRGPARPTAYMEAIDPVRTYYFFGWDKQGI